MTLYDSSVLIDYLDGEPTAVEYVKDHVTERAVAPELVLFELYQGELYKTGPADFDAVDEALAWLSVVDDSSGVARAAAELQAELHDAGATLAARDAFIAGAACALEEPLVASDEDFRVLMETATVDLTLL
ncbi:PIN domain-containing protein [Halolamina sp.]|uniref:PIN domain-containing protein n=1 Tax=Halolamina sp. TaxID=1940283 RepID=UPI003565C249